MDKCNHSLPHCERQSDLVIQFLEQCLELMVFTLCNTLFIHKFPFSLDCSGPVNDVRFSPSGPNLDVTIGEVQTIDCTVSSAEPDSRVFLHHNGTRLLTTTSSYNAETCIRRISLQLNGAMYSDAGNYTCVFNGDIQQTTSLSVNVLQGIHNYVFVLYCVGGSKQSIPQRQLYLPIRV